MEKTSTFQHHFPHGNPDVVKPSRQSRGFFDHLSLNLNRSQSLPSFLLRMPSGAARIDHITLQAIQAGLLK
jgi:hypothetical protein